jgi:hypothetical protein
VGLTVFLAMGFNELFSLSLLLLTVFDSQIGRYTLAGDHEHPREILMMNHSERDGEEC